MVVHEVMSPSKKETQKGNEESKGRKLNKKKWKWETKKALLFSLLEADFFSEFFFLILFFT